MNAPVTRASKRLASGNVSATLADNPTATLARLAASSHRRRQPKAAAFASAPTISSSVNSSGRKLRSAKTPKTPREPPSGRFKATIEYGDVTDDEFCVLDEQHEDDETSDADNDLLRSLPHDLRVHIFSFVT
eukprot:COSAG05_NODE_6804_length_900_cov_1.234707_1_plen_131_part_10